MKFVSDINGDQVNLEAVYKIDVSANDDGTYEVRASLMASAAGEGDDYVVLAGGFATVEDARAALASVHGEGPDGPKPEKPEKAPKDHSKKPFK